MLSSPKSRPDRSKAMPDWAPDWAARADRSMVDRSRPDMSRLEKSRPEKSMPEKSRPDWSICILLGSIWKAAESLDSSTVNREDMSKPPDWLFWLSASSLKVLPVNTSTSGLARWALTIGLAAASSMIW